MDQVLSASLVPSVYQMPPKSRAKELAAHAQSPPNTDDLVCELLGPHSGRANHDKTVRSNPLSFLGVWKGDKNPGGGPSCSAKFSFY